MGAQMEGTSGAAGRCPLEKRGCGGCPMLSLPYGEQLRAKQARLEALLGEFGPVASILGMEHPWHYRNKVISSFAWGPGKALVSGIYAQGTHRVVPVESCLLHQEALDRAVAAVRQAAREFRYQPFDENRRTGLIRHVLCRHSLTTGEVLAVLVTASPVLPGARAFAARVKELCPAIATLAQNINPRPGSAVLGEREKILYGRGYIEDTLCGVRFRISPSSFYQINPVQTQVLYSAAIAAAKLTGKERVLDAYCGVGTIGLSAAAHAGSVVGVELNRSAAACAGENAKANNIRNARFRCGDAAAFLDGMAARGEKLDVVFLDPPRAGSSPVFLDALCRVSPARAVYISCNPETQRRDLEYLAARGWRAESIQGVDMFPHTEHIETVVLLSHKKPDSTISVKVEFGEGEGKVPLDNISKRAEAYKPKERVTYKMIKEYIEAKYGFKVHTAYIAEVKRSLGLPMYDAPNAVEELKQPRKHPTAEKAEAIKDALKHFEVI